MLAKDSVMEIHVGDLIFVRVFRLQMANFDFYLMTFTVILFIENDEIIILKCSSKQY